MMMNIYYQERGDRGRVEVRNDFLATFSSPISLYSNKERKKRKLSVIGKVLSW